jgi:hypothetical protein
MLQKMLIAVLGLASVGLAQTYDRIAVSVGKQVITESAVVLDLRVSAFLDRMPVDVSPAKKREAAERLVDQLLILRDANESHLLEQVKKQFGSAEEYQAELRRYQIQESDVEAQLVSGLIALMFTDLRFRPGIQITDEDVRSFLSSTQDASTIEAPREEIEELLMRQRVTETLDKWLAETRGNSDVRFREQVFR